MQFCKPTFAESVVLVSVVGFFACLILIPDSGTAKRRSIERRARDDKPSEGPVLADRSLLAPDVALAGDWVTGFAREYSTLTFTRRDDGNYDVNFVTGGCLGGCKLSRTATFTQGAIHLSGAVAEYGPRTYDTLYAIQVGDGQYLLPAASVLRFERELVNRSDNWERHVFSPGRMPWLNNGWPGAPVE